MEECQRLISSPQAIKSELLASPASSSSSAERSFPQHRQYKVHVNKESARPLKKWMEENITHPYPSAADVKQLAQETGFSHQQIPHWFTNNRRRYEQDCIQRGEPLPWVKKEANKNRSRPSDATAPYLMPLFS